VTILQNFNAFGETKSGVSNVAYTICRFSQFKKSKILNDIGAFVHFGFEKLHFLKNAVVSDNPDIIYINA